MTARLACEVQEQRRKLGWALKHAVCSDVLEPMLCEDLVGRWAALGLLLLCLGLLLCLDAAHATDLTGLRWRTPADSVSPFVEEPSESPAPAKRKTRAKPIVATDWRQNIVNRSPKRRSLSGRLSPRKVAKQLSGGAQFARRAWNDRHACQLATANATTVRYDQGGAGAGPRSAWGTTAECVTPRAAPCDSNFCYDARPVKLAERAQ